MYLSLLPYNLCQLLGLCEGIVKMGTKTFYFLATHGHNYLSLSLCQPWLWPSFTGRYWLPELLLWHPHHDSKRSGSGLQRGENLPVRGSWSEEIARADVLRIWYHYCRAQETDVTHIQSFANNQPKVNHPPLLLLRVQTTSRSWLGGGFPVCV